MKALIEKKIELLASYQTVTDLNGYFKEIRITIYFLRIPIFHTRKFFTIPAEVPKSEISEELSNALSHSSSH